MHVSISSFLIVVSSLSKLICLFILFLLLVFNVDLQFYLYLYLQLDLSSFSAAVIFPFVIVISMFLLLSLSLSWLQLAIYSSYYVIFVVISKPEIFFISTWISVMFFHLISICFLLRILFFLLIAKSKFFSSYHSMIDFYVYNCCIFNRNGLLSVILGFIFTPIFDLFRTDFKRIIHNCPFVSFWEINKHSVSYCFSLFQIFQL